VRQAALARFNENNVRPGEPMSRLDETLVPLYFLHRYQTEAAAKVLGGLNYTYALRGDGQVVTAIVPAEEQKRALAALLDTLKPETLTLPEGIIALIPPHPPAYRRSPESFPAQTGLTFDPTAAAQAAASLTASLLFNPERAARLIEYHSRASENPDLTDVIRAVAHATWQAPARGGLQGSVKNAVDTVLFRQLLALRGDEAASPLVREEVAAWIDQTKASLPARFARMEDESDKHPERFKPAAAVEAPPGQPIGDDECVQMLCAQCSL
jgi:uncharacterized protein DUF4953